MCQLTKQPTTQNPILIQLFDIADTTSKLKDHGRITTYKEHILQLILN
jgi:hypothetical protein